MQKGRTHRPNESCQSMVSFWPMTTKIFVKISLNFSKNPYLEECVLRSEEILQLYFLEIILDIKCISHSNFNHHCITFYLSANLCECELCLLQEKERGKGWCLCGSGPALLCRQTTKTIRQMRKPKERNIFYLLHIFATSQDVNIPPLTLCFYQKFNLTMNRPSI